MKATDLAARYADSPPVSFIYTDIDRDGMMRGPNIEATEDFARNTLVPVILSGGVTTLADIERVLALEKSGVVGIIIGRALYEGTDGFARSNQRSRKRQCSLKESYHVWTSWTAVS